MRALSQLEKSQKKIFRSLQQELEMIERAKGAALRAYERTYQKALPNRLHASSKKELIRSVKSARVVLVGDFHSFRQSQKGFLRLLEAGGRAGTGVALECFSSDQQACLDHFSAGHITAEELREEVNFDRLWPFPWEHYREILDLCRKRSFFLLALNLPKKNRDPKLLGTRDQAAAENIQRAFSERGASQIFALIGELHLAPAHLPGRLKKIMGRPPLVVHQNEPSLYWRAPRTKLRQPSEVLKLRAQEFCILNSVPWMRLRSYLDWLEGNDHDVQHETQDFSEPVREIALSLAQILGLKATVADIQIFGPEYLAPGFRRPALAKSERILFRHARKFHRTAYLPVSKILLLPRLTTNALNESASLLLWESRLRARAAPTTQAQLIAQFFVGYLGSKILNPKRKCNEVVDLKSFLSHEPKKSSRRQMALRALSLLEPYLDQRAKKIRALPGPNEIEACRLVGYILANRLFHAWLKKPKLAPFLRMVYQSSNATSPWAEDLLAKVAHRIAQQKVTPPSKRAGF